MLPAWRAERRARKPPIFTACAWSTRIPKRAVRSLDIEALPVTWNGIAVLAITVDPLALPMAGIGP
jgi:hypothetical protein